jgi:hypothetical protein
MIQFLKESLFSNTILKILSVVIGYGIWSLLGNHRPTQHTFQVPVCFYNVKDGQKIQAPELLTIDVQAARADLDSLQNETLALHIDAEKLEQGKQTIPVNAQQLLLPDSFKVVHYNPAQVVIDVCVDTSVNKETIQTIT